MSDLILSTHRTAALFGRPAPLLVSGSASSRSSTAHPIGSLRIDPRLNGPRRSANGGFSAGTISKHVDADVVTVVLRRPVPLGRPMHVLSDGRGGSLVYRGRRLVAEARPGRLDDGPVPAPPSYEEALEARAAHPLAGLRHPLSDCIVCGPHRADGMHVTPGFVPGRPAMLTAPWRVGSRDAVGGMAPLDAVWGAMDCTSYPATALRGRELCLLGTMTALVERRPAVGEELVVYSWTREHRGRRFETSAVLVDVSGALVARADATWIALRHQWLHALRSRPRHSGHVPY